MLVGMTAGVCERRLRADERGELALGVERCDLVASTDVLLVWRKRQTRFCFAREAGQYVLMKMLGTERCPVFS